MTTTETGETGAEAEFVAAAVGRRRTVALFVVYLAMFMDLLDNTIVNVALPSIHRDLGGPYSTIQWIAAGYAIAFGGGLITGGRLGDIFGRKRLFLVGVIGFTGASAACGLSNSTDLLIGARVVQGLFAAMMVPQVLSIIQTMYAPKERGKALAAFGALAGLSTVGGPVLGALLTGANIEGLGWRSIFLVNLPVGVLAIILAAVHVPESVAPNEPRLDLTGAGLSGIALVMLTYSLVEGQNTGWPAWTYVCIGASLILLALFAVHQRALARRGGSPVVEPELFWYRSFSGGLLVSLFFMGGVIGYFFVFTIYLQTGLGFTVLRSGLTGIPWGLSVPLFAALAATALAPKLGRLTVQLGIVLAVVAMLTLSWTVGHASVTSVHLIPALAAGGVGMGLVLAPLLDFTLAQVPVRHAGSASGLLNTIQQVASALGIAAIGAFYFAQTSTHGHTPAEAGQSLQHTIWLTVASFMLALAATFLMPKRVHHQAAGK